MDEFWEEVRQHSLYRMPPFLKSDSFENKTQCTTLCILYISGEVSENPQSIILPCFLNTFSSNFICIPDRKFTGLRHFTGLRQFSAYAHHHIKGRTLLDPHSHHNC